MDSLKELCIRMIIALDIRIENIAYADIIRDSRALELLREDTAHHVAYLITRRIRLNIPLAARMLHHGNTREKWIVMSDSSELSNAAWYITYIRPMAKITRALDKSAPVGDCIKLLERFGFHFKPNVNPHSVRSVLAAFQSLFYGVKKGLYAVNYH